MRKVTTAAYSGVVYVAFLAAFLYAIGFVEDVLVPKSIDSSTSGSTLAALSIDAGLLVLFAIQHSVMARPGFKRVWTRIVPADIERSTYVLLASLALALICWQWRALPHDVWTVADPIGVRVLLAVSWAGWAMVLLSTFLISHFQLFGLSQGTARLFGYSPPEPAFTTPFFYKWLRHPIYAGFILAFWATPHMTVGHLFFAVATTGYILLGIWFEERDLVAQFGDRYRQYRTSVGMLFPKLRVASSRKTRIAQ